MRRSIRSAVCLWVAIAAFARCASPTAEAPPNVPPRVSPAPSAAPEPSIRAKAMIAPASGSSLRGEAWFVSQGGTTTLEIKIAGATPGPHAMHLHDKGDCSAPDASSAGGHWNPTHQDHGPWGQIPFHLGDIGNIDVNEAGDGYLQLTTELWEIGTGGEHDILGRAVIVHEKPDDFATQPTGAAGGRIGCGVVERG